MSLLMKKVTNNSWLASRSGNPLALFCEQEDGSVLVLTPGVRTVYQSMEEAKESLGGKVKVNAAVNSDAFANSNINGYPVKHDKFTIDDDGERPVYIRGRSSKHVAGYWGIRFSKRYIQSFCPLLKTIEQYEVIGPFKTRIEMMDAMKEANALIVDE